MTRIPLASEKTLLDEFAGQALTGLCSSWYDRHKDDPETQRGHGPTLISQSAYTHAEAMLAEKARREAVVKESSTTPDSGKMAELQAANRELVEALELAERTFSSTQYDRGQTRRAILAALAKHKESK